MLEKLREIDTSAIEKLVEIKQQRDRLEGFRNKAGEIKHTIDDAIYRRVLAEYQSRESALEEEAAPLKAECRREYEKLCSIYDELNEALDKVRVDKEELEFRHAVGEFNEAQLAEKLKQPEQVLGQCQSQLGEADKLKALFLSAFDSEEALEIAPHVEAEDKAEALVSAPEPSIPEPSREKEFVPQPSNAPQGTFVLPQAKLIMLEEGAPSDEYRLGVLNYVGRGEDNQIRITSPKVSRKHALVTANTKGFTIKDLKSRSGTYVNEESVTECALADGDRIKIGDVELVFRSL